MHYWNGGWHMGGVMLFWCFFALVVIAGVLWVIARTARGWESKGESPEDTLKRRYARGEIDHDEYLRGLADLRA